MKKRILTNIISAIFSTSVRWTYRPTTMRPAMRKRSFIGVEQCQVYAGGKWVKAQYPSSRYQWKPLVKKKSLKDANFDNEPTA